MRLIDADALIEKYIVVIKKAADEKLKAEIAVLLEDIENAPTVDAEPIRHGNWRFVNCATGLRCQCSECLHWVDAGTDRNHCPNCGARMDKE